MHTVEPWDSQRTYQHGEVVTHNGKVWQKDANIGDQTAPDGVPGGWDEVSGESNVADYNAIVTSFTSYEQRVKDHKAQVLAKLAAEGLDPDDVKAVLNA